MAKKFTINALATQLQKTNGKRATIKQIVTFPTGHPCGTCGSAMETIDWCQHCNRLWFECPHCHSMTTMRLTDYQSAKVIQAKILVQN